MFFFLFFDFCFLSFFINDAILKLRTVSFLPRNPKSMSVNMVIVCVEVLRPSQPSGVISSAVSLPNHTFTGQA